MERSANALSNEELESFLKALSTYSPAIPDQLINHYLSRSGFQTNDIRVERLVALAAQKFLADVSNDALAHSRLRQSTLPSTSKKSSATRDAKLTLTVDDLERSLRDYGVHLCKPPYFADSVHAGAPDPVVTGKPPVQPSNATQQAAPGGAGGGAQLPPPGPTSQTQQKPSGYM